MVMKLYQSTTLALSLDYVEDIETDTQQTFDLNCKQKQSLWLVVAPDLLTYGLFHAYMLVKLTGNRLRPRTRLTGSDSY